MNKQRFIERLNLYLDQELPTDESEELMLAIRRNPEYHRIYLQYCQIFNACSRFHGEFGGLRERSAWRHKTYAFGGMAAAVALLVLAAQNLSPLIVNQPGVAPIADGFAEVAEPLTTNEVAEGPLLVLSDRDLIDGSGLATGASVQRVALDSEPAFMIIEADMPFREPATFDFVRLAVESTNMNQTRWQRSFVLGDAVPSSTFEHESVTASDAGAPFAVQAAAASALDGTAIDGRERFDLNRVGALGSTESRR